MKDQLVSVALVMHNDATIIQEVIAEVQIELAKQSDYYEILIVDNGSTDNSVTLAKTAQATISNIRLVVLSRQYSTDIAYSAALDNSIGDYVIMMDLRCDPPVLISALMAEALRGTDVVIAERKDRADNTFWQKIFAKLFYSIVGKLTGIYLAPNAADFRVLSRRAVNSITQIKSKSRYIKYINAHVGFTQTYIPYDRHYRAGYTSRRDSFWQSLSRAIEVIISNSIIPLRLATSLGLIASFLNLLFIIYVLIVSLVKQQIAEGWISTSVVNSTMFFLLFLILTVVSEYVARILVESKDQPLYFIAEESTSKFLAAMKDKINVI